MDSATRVLEPARARRRPALPAAAGAVRGHSQGIEVAASRASLGRRVGDRASSRCRSSGSCGSSARTLVTIAALVGAFYVLLPQLANVGDSFAALRTANWAWLFVAAVLSVLTYVAAAVSTIGSVPDPLPFVPTVEAQMASSFVNRVTPANVGGMALNVRFMQKAGVEPAAGRHRRRAELVAGASATSPCWSCSSRGRAAHRRRFKIPTSSKTLVIIAVVLALVGVVVATRRGRKLVRTHVVGLPARSRGPASRRSPGRPRRLAGALRRLDGRHPRLHRALAACVAAFHGNVCFAEVGAVYLGAVAPRRRRADTGRPGRARGGARRRLHRRRAWSRAWPSPPC